MPRPSVTFEMPYAAYLEREMKRRMHPNRERILKVIKKHPRITISRIAGILGMTHWGVLHHVTRLMSDGLIHSVEGEREPGTTHYPGAGFCCGPKPEVVVEKKLACEIPKQWDVLAHFFGRIAEPVAA